jgi:hypothetical protein
MKEINVIFQTETDNQTYSEKTFVRAFLDETVAEAVAEELQNDVGFVNRFEEKTFSVVKVVVQVDRDFRRVNSIVSQIKRDLDVQ